MTPARDHITPRDFTPDAWDGLRLGLGRHGWQYLESIPMESWAGIFFLLRQMHDDPEVFPHGKSATLQHLESMLDAWGLALLVLAS